MSELMRRRTRGGSRLRRALRTLAKDGGAVACVSVLLYCVVFNLSVVRGRSMAPGIHDGDRILVEPWSRAIGDFGRGDIAVLRSPIEPGLEYIKRIVALAGDEVLIADGRLWVNDELVEEPYADLGPAGESPLGDALVWTRVREGHCFVLGDNRPHSSDSRDFGQIPADLLRGRVRLRVWPPDRAGLLD
ncbi:Signal peptidase I T [Planctomycetes bacterium Pla163]|uniref:Signal peptidase I n=2 Tax=Rohdeia mirabilis TaxID=2528008 RepID=A0A518CZ97_9BACT|nr:Signal peptidase I T [Planctomycetes bacterium Pla163]